MELFNKQSLLFFEEEFMENCTHFTKIIDKFKLKKFDNQLKYYSDSDLKLIEDYSKEVDLYNSIIKDNNINGLNKKYISISILHFSIYNDVDKVHFIQFIYILIFLANITEFENNRFIFKVKFDDRETSLNIDFTKIEFFNLIKIYTWIIDSHENIQTRVKIVRELILRKQSFKLNDEDLNNAKSAFNRVIREETDKYFTQVNMLKDDFIKLSEQKRTSYAALHLKLLAWGSSIALFVYGELEDVESKNLIKKLLFSKSEKSLIFIIIFILSILAIWLFFNKELQDSKNEYYKLKEFYTQKLFFEENDFSKFIIPPKTPPIYNFTFWIILLLLIARLIFIFI
jgi:hypothetical protein